MVDVEKKVDEEGGEYKMGENVAVRNKIGAVVVPSEYSRIKRAMYL